MKFSQNSCTILFLLLLATIAITVFFLHYPKVIEGFSQEYQYLAPLPPNNAWSQSTIDAFTTTFKTVRPGSTVTEEYLKQLQQNASEAEAVIFAKTKLWPWDDYVTTNLPSTFNPTDISRYQSIMPNRMAYLSLIAPNTVDVYKVLTQLNTNSQAQGVGYANSAGTGGIACQVANTSSPYLYTYTGNATNGITIGPKSTDYSLFEQYIPNFKFTGTPYDVCTSNMGSSPAPIQFEITGSQNPEAWNIYNGTVTDSTPATAIASSATAIASSATTTPNNTIYQDFISLCKKAIPTTTN